MCNPNLNFASSLIAPRAQNLLSEDSEAHLLQSVVSKPGQQMRLSDNYRSNGEESTRSSTPNSEINNDNPVNLSMRREFQHPTIVSEIINQDEFMDNSSDSGTYMQGEAFYSYVTRYIYYIILLKSLTWQENLDLSSHFFSKIDIASHIFSTE